MKMPPELSNAAGPILDELRKGAARLGLEDVLAGKGNFTSGAAVGGLAGLLLGSKSGRKLAGNAAQLGVLAIVGGLAYRGFQNWQARQAQGHPPADATASDAGRLSAPRHATTSVPSTIADDPAANSALTRCLTRAMVAAAKADGRVTADERARIEAELARADVDASELDLLARELAAPLDLDRVVADATSPEIAAQIYTASLLAIDGNSAAEGGYLALLAARLGLSPELCAELEAEAERA